MDISPHRGDDRRCDFEAAEQQAQQHEALMSGSHVARSTERTSYRQARRKTSGIACSARRASLTRLPIEIIAIINRYLLPRDQISLGVCRRLYLEKFHDAISGYSALYAEGQRVNDFASLDLWLASVDHLMVALRPAYLATFVQNNRVLRLVHDNSSRWTDYTLLLREELTDGARCFLRPDALCALLAVRFRTAYAVRTVDVYGDAKAVTSLPLEYWPTIVDGMLTMPCCLHLLQGELFGYPSMLPLREILMALAGSFVAGNRRVSERALIVIAAMRLFDTTQSRVGRHVRRRFGLSSAQLRQTILPGIARLLAYGCVNGKMSLSDALRRWGPDPIFEEIVSDAFLDVLHLELKISRNRMSRESDSAALLDVSRVWLWRDGTESATESLDAVHLLGFDPVAAAIGPNGREMLLHFWHLYVLCKKVRHVREAETQMTELSKLPLRMQPFIATVLVDQCLLENLCGYTAARFLRQLDDWEATTVRQCLRLEQPGLALRGHIAAIRMGNAHTARCVDLYKNDLDRPSLLFSDWVQSTIAKTPVSEWGCLLEMVSDYPCHQAQGTWSERHIQYLVDTMRLFLVDPASRMRYPSVWFVEFALSYVELVWDPACAGTNDGDDEIDAFCRRFDITEYSTDALSLRLRAGAFSCGPPQRSVPELAAVLSRKPKVRLPIKGCAIC
jgi:hypothetical protein